MMSKERKIIKVPIPKEIWDADMSLFNVEKLSFSSNIIMGYAFRDIMGTWMKSVLDAVKQCNKPTQRR